MEQGLLMEVFAILNQIARNGTVSAQAQPISKPVDDVIRYINEHLSEDLPLSLLAETAHFSTQHLLREFKSVMGISIHRYIMAKRLLTAHQYLESGMSASETASSCGFNDYSAFYRANQKHYHCAPSASVKSELNS
ncbi:MAG: AraC family transcriptional regulator [Solobacterium sp.]|jgi:AraC-like DNA-binding protein|nr:AraC family transcriptional regulator [Solobacterium sp.]MCH4222265.1 AraC family transcriptional regulator [Solobacterium sp.]MCH4265368.1 AraC family transcriptional regulator [Solobacterium sp.]